MEEKILYKIEIYISIYYLILIFSHYEHLFIKKYLDKALIIK